MAMEKATVKMQLIDADWPLFGWTSDIRQALKLARQKDTPVVLGTLTRVTGSSPRPAGTQMVFDGESAAGYFSGGCLEADVANHALSVLQSGEPARLLYGEGSPWIDIRLLCGGGLEIFLERIQPDDEAVDALLRLSAQRKPVCWQSDGFERHVNVGGQNPAFQQKGTAYSLCYDPVWRLIVVGGDPITLATAALGALSGFQVLLIRPNGPPGPPPIANVDYDCTSAQGAIKHAKPDQWTAVIAANHDDEWDDEVLRAVLEHDPGYLGVLGSRTRASNRLRRLKDGGLSMEKIDQIHSPIGALPTGKAPWEVAVSVIAEIMQLRNRSSIRAKSD